MPDAEANLIPGAAESWTISDDGTVYTFKLRDDAVWSNGDPVTAEDFVYSFGRLREPGRPAPNTPRCSMSSRMPRRSMPARPRPEEIGARAIDAQTLEDHAQRADAVFSGDADASGGLSGASGHGGKFGADWTKPGNLVSNGAFTLAEWVPNDHVKIVKNPKFHDADSVKLDAVNFYPTKDSSTAMKRFEAGEIDSNDDLPTEQLADLRAQIRRPGACRPLSRHLLLRDQARQGAVEQSEAPPRHLARDRPRLPRREGVGRQHVPGLQHGAARHRRLQALPRPTMPTWISSRAKTRRRRF